MGMGRGAARRLPQLLVRHHLARRPAARDAGLGVWLAGAVWFCTGGRSRKARNLAADPRCVVATEDALDPVVVEGSARIRREEGELTRFLEVYNAKYATQIGRDFLDPDVNVTVEVRPERAFGLLHDDFTGSPTRWTF